MPTSRFLAITTSSFLLACSGKADNRGTSTGTSLTGVNTSDTTGVTTTTTATESTTDTESSGGTDSTSGGSATTAPTTSSGTGIKFDVGTDSDLSGAGDGGDMGCEKVDFLFVVDNSGSMEDEQQNLVTSFPGFIDTIQNTLMAKDYHVMVVDTDEGGGGSISVQCTPDPTCCTTNWCMSFPQATCNGKPCTPVNDDCDITLGAGKVVDQNNNDCGFTSGSRYMLDSQPNLASTFQCAALVGTTGDGNERPMDAAIAAITTETQPGECNEGFLRDDAILVVTVISDEEDDMKSAGNPPDWVDAMVQAKNGDETAVVALAVVGDTDLPNAICQPLQGNDGADAAPRLRTWAETFTYGMSGSICVPDFAPFFEEAVSVIDSACDDFKPPG